MSDRKPSRAYAVSRLPIMTMADVLEAIAADRRLSSRQRQERRSAVKTLCRWLGKDGSPGEITAEIRIVHQLMADLAPAACTAKSRTGEMRPVSNGRRANVMSLVHRSLIELRADLVDTRRTPLSGAWQDLFAGTDPVLKRSCGRFARWCSAKAIFADSSHSAPRRSLCGRIETQPARVTRTSGLRQFLPRLEQGSRTAFGNLAANKN
jgi:hypothetical protein